MTQAELKKLVEALRAQRHKYLSDSSLRSKEAGRRRGRQWAADPNETDYQTLTWLAREQRERAYHTWLDAIPAEADSLLGYFPGGEGQHAEIFWEGFVEAALEVWESVRREVERP
jgi:hypothetical protein